MMVWSLTRPTEFFYLVVFVSIGQREHLSLQHNKKNSVVGIAHWELVMFMRGV